jgi:transcriptional regulator with XRE-family HTH domain
MGQICNHILISQIAKKIKHERENNGITQENFYFDTNIHIGRIETAKVNISVSTLDAICSYLNTDLATFFQELSVRDTVE